MIQLITKEFVIKYFTSIQEYLMKNENRKPILLTRDWTKSFPNTAGVYCIFEDDTLKYVGETGSIKGRMADLLNTKNHNFRRLLGNVKYSSHIGYEKANSYKSFNPEIELKLNNWIINHCKVACLPINIGRKEFEDWLQDAYSEIIFLNKRKKRK
jgi:hypothetical protein